MWIKPVRDAIQLLIWRYSNFTIFTTLFHTIHSKWLYFLTSSLFSKSSVSSFPSLFTSHWLILMWLFLNKRVKVVSFSIYLIFYKYKSIISVLFHWIDFLLLFDLHESIHKYSVLACYLNLIIYCHHKMQHY